MLILALSVRTSLGHWSTLRKALFVVTAVLVVFGTAKGYFSGHAVRHIARFTLPLTVFLLLLSLNGLGTLIVRSLSFLLWVVLALTLYFFLIVKTGRFETADDFMAGWTLTYSSNAAISTWHYFALPVCVAVLFSSLRQRLAFTPIVRIIASAATLSLLVLLTDTAAFVIAIAVVVGVFLVNKSILRLGVLPVLALFAIYIFDFLTLKIINRRVFDYSMGLGIEDIGDLLRLIQMEYFIERASIFGSGFGASHDFPFMISVARQQAQIEYPYASELPILNIIFNGGVFAATWFVLVVYALARVLLVDATGDQRVTVMRYFALGCGGILIGSLSNPYLFAPGAMLLLVAIVDMHDAIVTPKSSRDRRINS